MTKGAIRAVYLKHATCAVYPDDIFGQQCDAQGRAERRGRAETLILPFRSLALTLTTHPPTHLV